MTEGLHRYRSVSGFHFITTSCYHRQSLFDNVAARDLFLENLERIRTEFEFVIVGYVVMPSHVHLLVTSERKKLEKLKYIHRNPVKAGLVESPEDWKWSSFRHYACGETGVVGVEIPVLAKQFKAASSK